MEGFLLFSLTLFILRSASIILQAHYSIIILLKLATIKIFNLERWSEVFRKTGISPQNEESEKKEQVVL